MTATGDYSNLPLGCFAHPEDRKALAALKRLPGVEWATKRLTKHSYAAMLEVVHSACSIEATETAFSNLLSLADAYAGALDVSKPRIFVQNNPRPDAFLAGTDSPFVVITSGMLDLLDDEELECLMAHLVSHLHCEHLPYLMVCDFMRDFSDHLGAGKVMVAGVQLALEEWRRRAEYSCDRGALLLTGNEDALLRMLGKLASGAPGRYTPVGKEQLLTQYHAFKERLESLKLGRMYRMMMYLDSRRSFSIPRAFEVFTWSSSTEYAACRRGEAPPKPETEADVEEGKKVLWGAFGGSQDDSEEPAKGCPFCGDDGCIGQRVVGEARGAADKASGFVQDGAKAFGKAFDAFFTTFKDSMKGAGGDDKTDGDANWGDDV